MNTMARSSTRVVLLLLLIGCSLAPMLRHNSAQATKTITVQVLDSKDYHPLEGARVFVQDYEGKEIVASSTDRLGIARIPVVPDSQRPKYLLVEHSAYFITGMRFQSGLLEYYLLATIFTVR